MAQQVRPEWLGPRLAKIAEDINWILEALTESSVVGVDQATGRDVVKLAAMPKTAIMHAQGLAFVKRRKVGALLGVTKERVVLVGKTHGPDGTPVWSGPVFLKANSVSLGFTAGSFKMTACTAIMNDKGMSNALRPHANLGFNAAFLIDMNGSRVRSLRTSSSGTQSQVTMDKDGGMVAKYYLLEAGMVDLSCRGGSFGLDHKMNSAIYGSNFDAQAVLQCKTQPPPEFAPVYNRLNEYTKEARAMNPRITSMDRLERSTQGGGGPGSGGPSSGGPSRSSSMQHVLPRRSDSSGGDIGSGNRGRISAGSTADGQQQPPQQQQAAGSPRAALHVAGTDST